MLGLATLFVESALAQRIRPRIRSDAHHQLVADDPASHVAAAQEAQAAEQLPLA